MGIRIGSDYQKIRISRGVAELLSPLLAARPFSGEQDEMACSSIRLPIFFKKLLHAHGDKLNLAAFRPARSDVIFPTGSCLTNIGAGDEDRTRNFQLGKLTLYH